jgi:hypothetical protein
MPSLLAATHCLFNNDAFLATLGNPKYSTRETLIVLNCMVRLSKSIRVELLSSDVSKTRKRRRGVTAEDALLQPASLLQYVVGIMFKYDQERAYATSMSAKYAARKFALQGRQMVRVSEKRTYGHDSRFTLLELLPILLARKGGLRRVGAAAATRAKARATGIASFAAVAGPVVENWSRPLLARARRALANDASSPTILDGYRRLKVEVGALTTIPTALTTRRGLAALLASAKKYAHQLDVEL